jgi:hypothetical protein
MGSLTSLTPRFSSTLQQSPIWRTVNFVPQPSSFIFSGPLLRARPSRSQSGTNTMMLSHSVSPATVRQRDTMRAVSDADAGRAKSLGMQAQCRGLGDNDSPALATNAPPTATAFLTRSSCQPTLQISHPAPAVCCRWALRRTSFSIRVRRRRRPRRLLLASRRLRDRGFQDLMSSSTKSAWGAILAAVFAVSEATACIAEEATPVWDSSGYGQMQPYPYVVHPYPYGQPYAWRPAPYRDWYGRPYPYAPYQYVPRSGLFSPGQGVTCDRSRGICYRWHNRGREWRSDRSETRDYFGRRAARRLND